jgi:hypothetical protein
MNIQDFKQTKAIIEIESIYPFEMRMRNNIVKAKDMKAQN